MLVTLSQTINGKVSLQEANLLENGCYDCYHCNMHLKIGHGHEERHRKENYVVLIPQKVLTICSSPVEKNNKKMNKMAYFSYLKSTFIGSF